MLHLDACFHSEVKDRNIWKSTDHHASAQKEEPDFLKSSTICPWTTGIEYSILVHVKYWLCAELTVTLFVP